MDGEEAVRDRLAASGGEQVVADGGTGAAGVPTGTQWTREPQILILSHGLVHDTCGKDTVATFTPVPFLLLLPVIFDCSVSVYSLYVCFFSSSLSLLLFFFLLFAPCLSPTIVTFPTFLSLFSLSAAVFAYGVSFCSTRRFSTSFYLPLSVCRSHANSAEVYQCQGDPFV